MRNFIIGLIVISFFLVGLLTLVDFNNLIVVDGKKIYANKKADLLFEYPEKWGEIDTYYCSENSNEFRTGDCVSIYFSNDESSVLGLSSDYSYPGESPMIPFWGYKTTASKLKNPDDMCNYYGLEGTCITNENIVSLVSSPRSCERFHVEPYGLLSFINKPKKQFAGISVETPSVLGGDDYDYFYNNWCNEYDALNEEVVQEMNQKIVNNELSEESNAKMNEYSDFIYSFGEYERLYWLKTIVRAVF